ncbi:MAG TPA: GlsB/YeaQ/YmgE family stress response membrane protein [Bryobacteraceae bacterium]|nr:GlsB/YeaQ/YmgE family stress response membrane protein [Bryobacteraceae bacterium]
MTFFPVSLVALGAMLGIAVRWFLPKRTPGEFIVAVLLGMSGAIIGGCLGRLFDWYSPLDAIGVVMAFLGSSLLLGLYRSSSGSNSA